MAAKINVASHERTFTIMCRSSRFAVVRDISPGDRTDYRRALSPEKRCPNVASCAAPIRVDRGLLMPDKTAMRLVGAALSLSVLGVALMSCAPSAATSPPQVIRITTGLPGMTFKPLGEALARAFQM